MAFIHYRSLGIFLTKEEKGEADQLFTIFTENFGRLEILAKGIRKITSKLRPGVELFSLSEIEFIQGKNYKTLTDAILIEKFKNIKKDFQKLTLLYKIGEIVSFLTNQDEKDEKVWSLLKETFDKLNNPLFSFSQTNLIYFFFFWNLISFLGYKPELYFCLGCQKRLFPETLWFFPQEGGIFCWSCLKNFSLDKKSKFKEIEVEVIKILRIFNNKDWKILHRLRIEENDLRGLENFFSSYYSFLKEEFS